MGDGLYDGPCVPGCQHYHGGEIRHHKDCGHYAESLTRCFEDRIADLERQLSAARRCPLCGGRTQDIAVKLKPLAWEAFGTMAFIAEAPLFGRLRVEQFGRGNTWTVCFSVPGYSDTFLEGEWPDAETAKAAAQADYERRILSAIEAAPVQSAQHRPSVAEAAVSEHFHDEQVRIWTQEILEALALHDQYRPETYDDKVVANEVIARELVDIGKAIDTMRMTSRAALRALAGEDGQ